jgi:hypothetical protein
MSISVAVHPQLMLQLSEQFTRFPFLNPRQEHSLGVILGFADGPRIEACSAIEVGIRTGGAAGVRLATQDYNSLLRLHHQIYKDEKPIGWYSCQPLSDQDKRVFHTLFEALEHTGPFLRGEFLDREQPFILFLQRGEGWVSIEYSYESAPAERIAMMQLQAEGNAESQVAFTADAYRSLDRDLEKIEVYLKKVANKQAPFDPVLIRKCAEIGQWWDHKAEIDEEKVVEQENLGLLIGLLAQRLGEFTAFTRAQRTS